MGDHIESPAAFLCLVMPFVHLIVDERMLPPESIRFFYVDGNYLDALCDGAASVGVHTSRDVAQHEVVRPMLQKAAVARYFTMVEDCVSAAKVRAGSKT